MFRKKRSLPIRIWHWANAIIIIGLLLTVLLRKTILSVRTNGNLFKTNLETAGVTVTTDQSRALARILKDKLWDWHEYMGYVLAALVIVRIVAIFFEKKEITPSSLHFKLVYWSYKIFYLALGIMVFTGLALSFDEELKLSKPIIEILSGTHENLMWLILAFVVAHLFGVIKAEQGEDKGLVSDMINGG